MEDNTVRVNEIEEVEPTTEVEEAPESSNGGAFVAGIAGGFLAYALIGGVRKLVGFIEAKRAERKLKDASNGVVETTGTVVEDDTEDSGEEPTEE